MNLEISKNYIPARDYYNSVAGAALQINDSEFMSFNKTASSFLMKAMTYIVTIHDNEQAIAETPVICPKIEDMRTLITRLKAKEPISFYGTDFANYLEIKPCGKVLIGEYISHYIYFINADCSHKVYNVNFHDNYAEDYGTLFRINRLFLVKLSSGNKRTLLRKLRVLNNSLDSTRKFYAKRITGHLKEKKTLCLAFDSENQPVLINPAFWGVAYCVNHACEITRIPTSEAPPLYGLWIHKKGYNAEMNVAKSTEIEDFILKEYHEYPNGHPYGNKNGFLAHTKQYFTNDGKHFPMIIFNNAWDRIFKGKKAVPGWSEKPKAKIDQKKPKAAA